MRSTADGGGARCRAAAAAGALVVAAACGGDGAGRGAGDGGPADAAPGRETTGAPAAEGRLVRAAEVSFDPAASTAVVSRARKFVVPVPALAGGGEPLVYPPGHPSAGRPVLDHRGRPVGARGLLFLNAADRSWQAAPGTGEAVVIVNEVGEADAERLYGYARGRGMAADRLTLAQLKDLLGFARDSLGLGDMYNSTRAYVGARMRAAAPRPPRELGDAAGAFGAFERTAADTSRAVFVPGRFAFAGPAATPQRFADGGVLVRHGDDVRGVQPDVFARTYRAADGAPIADPAAQLKRWRP